ncbi:IncA protein [Chlamydia sp.]|uniref:IncA protein n=1 Tax=Chlamydia sp. TaxID=35827 RepID=UPI0025BE7351|nr:IncA protein [Chlamydia sp.]MBQ8499052.1 IncA protein [Chlamydia sp.]
MSAVGEKNSFLDAVPPLIEGKSLLSKIKTCNYLKIVDIALAILGAVMIVTGVLTFVVCAGSLANLLSVVALILGSLCVGVGIARVMNNFARSNLENQNFLIQRRLRNLREDKEALVSLLMINQQFLRKLAYDVQTLEAKVAVAEAASSEAMNNEKSLLSDMRLVLSSYTRWLRTIEEEKLALRAVLDKS